MARKDGKTQHEKIADDLVVLRDRMLEAALPHVPFDGWSERAMAAGEAASGLGAGAAYRAFPGGLADMAAHASDYFDRRMLERLDQLDLSTMKVREKVSAGVRARIEACAPHKQAHRRLLSYLALPTHKVMATRLAWETCNRIWYAAGDEATDFNYYTKRGLLFPVYTTTVLYWHTDASDGYADTWGYLDRRIADVMKIPGYQARFKKSLTNLPNPLNFLKRTA
ncbi:MAG: COQ9 family protein [Rhodospirillales bacterium]